jgi:hypothetical protein
MDMTATGMLTTFLTQEDRRHHIYHLIYLNTKAKTATSILSATVMDMAMMLSFSPSP